MRKKIALLAMALMLIIGCDDIHWGKYFMVSVNNSCVDSLLFVLDRFEGDSTITLNSQTANSINILYPESNHVFSSKEQWRKRFGDNPFVIYIFDQSGVDDIISFLNGEWGSIHPLQEEGIKRVKTLKLLVEYHLTVKEMEDLDWSFFFPPNERMKDIYMWPPYEEVVAQYRR